MKARLLKKLHESLSAESKKLSAKIVVFCVSIIFLITTGLASTRVSILGATFPELNVPAIRIWVVIFAVIMLLDYAISAMADFFKSISSENTTDELDQRWKNLRRISSNYWLSLLVRVFLVFKPAVFIFILLLFLFFWY